jgi:hypothetical protein
MLCVAIFLEKYEKNAFKNSLLHPSGKTLLAGLWKSYIRIVLELLVVVINFGFHGEMFGKMCVCVCVYLY